mgnify:CR=1 FL=1
MEKCPMLLSWDRVDVGDRLGEVWRSVWLERKRGIEMAKSAGGVYGKKARVKKRKKRKK